MSGGAGPKRAKKRKSRSQLSNNEIADRHLSNFVIYQRRGEIRQSYFNLTSALALLPSIKEAYYSSFLETFESWSTEVEENSGFESAVKLFEVALRHYPESADVKHLLAKILYRNGNIYESWSYACLAQSECPQDPNARELRGRLANALIDRWHIPMLNDIQRNWSFKSAIEAAVNDGHDEVLDVGSGTGLLSIFAKRAGAKKVFGCEVDKFMCEMANNVLKTNAGTKGITIYNLHSRGLNVPTHLPQRASLLVSETVDAGLFGEHILSTLQHAWSHLLLPPPPAKQIISTAEDISPVSTNVHQTLIEGLKDLKTESRPSCNDLPSERSVKYGKVIPSHAEVFVALISCKYIANYTKLQDADLLTYFKGKKVLLKQEEPYLCEKLNRISKGFKLLSEWTQVTEIDFNSPREIDLHLNGLVNRTLNVICTSGGTVDALALAFNLHLDDNHHISTLPDKCSAAWENAVYPVAVEQVLSENDVLKVDFDCHGGVMNLSAQSEIQIHRKHTVKSEIATQSRDINKETVFLSASALNFITRKTFIDEFLAATQKMAMNLKNRSKRNDSHSFIVCDITPFPIAGLSVMSLFPKVELFVEEESIVKTLSEIGVQAKLTEDLEEEVDLLFMWPVTKEGTLQDGIVKKILMYRLMMAEDGLVFPQNLDLVIDVIHSEAVENMTQVDDVNTCGVQVADVFNITKTSHHIDIHLDTLPHTSVMTQPIPILQLSLATGDVKPRWKLCDRNRQDDLLIIGGDVMAVLAEAKATESSVVNAVPYWFTISADLNTQKVSFCTRDEDSPCNQSLLMLEDCFGVQESELFGIEVIWRDGIFSAGVTN